MNNTATVKIDNCKVVNINDYKLKVIESVCDNVHELEVKTNVNQSDDFEIAVDKGIKPLATEDISRIKEYMLTKPERYKGTNVRDYAILVVGMNIGKRISDLLNIKVGNVLNVDNTVVDSYTSVDQKTKKKITIYFNSNAKEAITMLLNSKDCWETSDYLFQSRNGKKLSRNRFWEIMNKAGNDLNLDYSVGTHTLRKTWASQAVIQSEDNYNAMSEIQSILGHSKRETTMIYTEQNKKERQLFMENVLV